MSELTKQIGENIKTYRKRLNLKMYVLAKMIGVNNLTMSRIEKGSSALKVTTIEDIAKALNLSFEQVVFGEETIVLNNSTIQKLKG